MGPTLRRHTTPSSVKLFGSHTVWFPVQKFYPHALLVFLGVLSHVLTCYSAGQQPSAKNVLVLFSGINTDNQFMDLIEPVIRARAPTPTTFYDAYLILEPDEQKRKRSWQSEAETLRSTYTGVKLDLVIAVSSPLRRTHPWIRTGLPLTLSQALLETYGAQCYTSG